jgi:hypothetical protein
VIIISMNNNRNPKCDIYIYILTYKHTGKGSQEVKFQTVPTGTSPSDW